jgi:hypothetical protein
MTATTLTDHEPDHDVATEAEDDEVELAIGAPLGDYLSLIDSGEIDKGGDHGLAPR